MGEQKGGARGRVMRKDTGRVGEEENTFHSSRWLRLEGLASCNISSPREFQRGVCKAAGVRSSEAHKLQMIQRGIQNNV
eukprot:750485-Hanusia_phi.AAC.2